MRKLVTNYYESGQSKSVFARTHGISKGKLSYWIHKFPRKEAKEPVKSNFVPLSVPPSAQSSTQSMFIRLGNGVEIEIPF
jgi:transposase-like protein